MTPSFGGIIGNYNKSVSVYVNKECIEIINKANCKLFVTPNSNNKYEFNDDVFLWTGGFKYPKQDLNTFDYKSIDSKFIYLKHKNGKVKIFTDHFSKIPFLYFSDGSNLYFATSLELLRRIIPNSKLILDEKGLLFYYNFGFTSYDHFLFRGIKSLAGGKELCYKDSELSLRTYFNVFDSHLYTSNNNTLNNNVLTIDKYLLSSTKKSLNLHDSIGIALSGGVDSGYLAQKINECGRDFNAYTLGFENDYNEFDRIDYLSKKLNFKAKKIILNSSQIISNYEEVCGYSSFPVSFNNSILNFIYDEASNDGVDLMFDGDGADRMFLGMNKYLQLNKVLKLYSFIENIGLNHVFEKVFRLFKSLTTNKLAFYFSKLNDGFPFYGERKLSNISNYQLDFEKHLNDIALPQELKELNGQVERWLFFSLFSAYYTPTFFFHTPYELQLQHNLVSNPQFWSDDLVKFALSIPTKQKLYKSKTKLVLREAAKLKIDDGYWNLSKIGLQNSYNYIKTTKEGEGFVNDYLQEVAASDEYRFLKESIPQEVIDKERLLPLIIWKTVHSSK